MIRLFLFLLLLIASVWIGIEVVRHPGYLLIVYHPWMMQMPIWFAALSLLVLFGIFYFLIDSVDRIQFLWFRFKNWLRRRQEHRSYSKTQHGLAMLIEGRFKKAERLLLDGVNQSIEPLMNYLGAAKAAHELGEFARRDNYIKKAYQTAPDASVAIGLTQAELELSQDQLEQAAATLRHLNQIQPRHPMVLKLLEKVYVRLADWENLLLLVPSLRKAKLITKEQAQQFEKNIYAEMLNSAKGKELAYIQHLWQQMPRGVRYDPDVAHAYVKQLLRFINTSAEIEEIIRKTLKYHYQADLVLIYGELSFANLNRQLVVVGAWLKMYGGRPEILLTLARLCVRLQLWGKAKDYFVKCLALEPNPQALLEYGELLQRLGENELALQTCFSELKKMSMQSLAYDHPPIKIGFDKHSIHS